MEWGYKWRTWYTELNQSCRSPLPANINFWKSEPSQSTSTFEQPTCGSKRRPLCRRRWIPNTTEFAAASNAEGSDGNEERLKAWLQINLTTREIPWLWIGQGATRTGGREILRGQPNARSQHRQTSVLPEDLHLCQFSISHPIELLYQLQSDQYLLFSADHQSQVYKCIGNNWSRLSITAGISLLILSNKCDLNLTEYQIYYLAYYQPVPVIKLIFISSVPSRPRKFYPKTQTIIELVAFCILIFLSIIVSVHAIIKHLNRPHLIQHPL